MHTVNNIVQLVLLFLVLSACTGSKEEKKEKNPLSDVEQAKQRFTTEIEGLHKKEKFLSESYVSYEISYEFGNLSDVFKVVAATDLSAVQIESTHYGKSYYDGNQLYMDANSNSSDREVKRNFQMVYFYHAFFHLNEIGIETSPVEDTAFMETKYKQFNLTNNAFHLAFFPRETAVLIENRTNMMKGLQLKTSLLGNARTAQKVHLHYDRFITVNHIPVSLNWKFYPIHKLEEETLIGEAKITKIKYPKPNQIQLEIPKDAIAIKNASLL